MTKILYVVTVSQSIRLLHGQLDYMIDKGFEVHLITSDGKEIKKLREDINIHIVEMKRDISPVQDIKSLFVLWRQIKRIKPDIINYGTPKASLLGSVTSFFLRVPNRLYTIRGLRYETLTGVKRSLMINIEKVIMKLSTDLISISPSMRETIIKNNITKKYINVLGSGSSNGIPTEKYKETILFRDSMRKRYAINHSTQLIGFVGRLANDKGISALVQSFCNLSIGRNIKLLLVGQFDKTDPLPYETLDEIQNHRGIIHVYHQTDVVPYYSMMDIFVFPTLREGFGNVSIEAAASGLPVVASNVTGAKDTIIDNTTGYLFEVNNVTDLTNKIEHLINNKSLMIEFGENGKERVHKEFDNKVVWNNWYDLYSSICNRLVKF